MFLDRHPDNINLFRSGREGWVFAWLRHTPLENVAAPANVADVFRGIVAKGSHKELLASSAEYRSIYESQLGPVPT